MGIKYLKQTIILIISCGSHFNSCWDMIGSCIGIEPRNTAWVNLGNIMRNNGLIARDNIKEEIEKRNENKKC